MNVATQAYSYISLVLPNLFLTFAVIAVANGLQAWKILEDMTNHIDIILTEVSMPILSGFGLLCKIMSHKTFKNVPVISEYFLRVIILLEV